MSSWLRLLFGLRENEVPPDSELRFELGGVTGRFDETTLWIAGLLLLGIVILIVLLYRREHALGVWQRLLLSSLRLLALLVVIYMLLDPRLHTELTLVRQASTLVLFDTSGSMSRDDEYETRARRQLERASGLRLRSDSEEASRAELAWSVLKTQRIDSHLARSNQVRFFAFDSEVRALEGLEDLAVQTGNEPAEVLAEGNETKLGDAIRTAVGQVGDNPVAAVVVVSDGQANAGESAQRVANELARRGIAVHAVGVGKSRIPRNYAVTEVSAPEVVEVGYPLRLQARVQAAGLRGPYTVLLERRSLESGERETVDRRELDNDGASSSRRLSFTDTLPAPGKYEYTVAISVHSEEIDTADNRKRARVIAADERRRVLLLAGNGSFEYRYVRNFLLRDNGVQASCWLASADDGYSQDGDVVLQKLPRGEKDLRLYDVVILLDPDPGLLTAEFLAGLEDFVVKQGGGLAYVAGECHSPHVASRRELGGLRGLLPVVLGGEADSSAGVNGWRPLPTRRGADHPLCLLKNDPVESLKLWNRMPPLFFAAPTRGLKPAASDLLKRPDGATVMAIHRPGAGFVVYIGSDGLWRWRAARAQGLHERFWASVVRYLAQGKKLAGSRDASLDTDRDRYQVGDEIQIEASVMNSAREPVLLPRLGVVLERDPFPGQRSGRRGSGARLASAETLADEAADKPVRLELRPVAARPGWYRGQIPADKAGRYRLALDESSGAGATADVGFVVRRPTAEWEEPSPNHELLQDVAARTRGSFVSLEDARLLPERIPDRSVEETVGRAVSSVWDSAAVMILLCGLMILEWSLRKVWRLN